MYEADNQHRPLVVKGPDHRSSSQGDQDLSVVLDKLVITNRCAHTMVPHFQGRDSRTVEAGSQPMVQFTDCQRHDAVVPISVLLDVEFVRKDQEMQGNNYAGFRCQRTMSGNER